ncbi:hypothetical protein GCM10027449_15910 [Sinomonas notoginsengisoli]|uniref:hypothetical protein n=1 Tax=Sinomonas notoginsengisoli TaxID=1457311 RepID=UPI001F472B07|nr:hypothetical protein [Sinomonas notoginsengisoli]
MSVDVEPAAESVVEEQDVADGGDAERPAPAVVDRALIASLWAMRSGRGSRSTARAGCWPS